MTATIDWHVRLRTQADAEAFSEYIRDAVVRFLAPRERFSSIRLSQIPMRYNDFMHPRMLGQASISGIQVRESAGGAIDLAGTVVHELAHALVGPSNNHNENWREACVFLGLKNTALEAGYTITDFSDELLAEIASAIQRFAAEHPDKIYDPNMEIPIPSHWGLPTCPGYDVNRGEECEFGHKKHIRQFQLDGARWMIRRIISGKYKNVLNGDDMGTGKTVEDILVINYLHPKRLLIVVPNNVKYVWRDHILDLCVHQDIKDAMEVGHSALYPFSDVVIINYEAVVKWQSFINAEPWDLFIGDEFHYCKTPNTKRSRAVFSIKADHAIGNTGSPIVNYPAEIFPLIHYLDRETWPEWGRFANRYEGYGHKFGRNLTELNNKLRSTIMLRRLKKDVLKELPRKIRQVIGIETTPEIQKLIDEEMRLFKSLTMDMDAESIRLVNTLRNESDPMGDDLDWITLIENLKNTKKFAFEEMARLAHAIGRAKVPMAIQHITDVLENREKCVVFGHHRDVLKAIADHFKPHSVLLLGGTGDQAAATAMASRQFSDNDDITVFVGGITIAQGYSLKGSSTVVFVEEDWVPGVVTQAEDRSHGLGRGDAEAGSLLVQHLVFEDSLDTHKAQLTIKKQKSIDRATGTPKPKELV